MKNMTSGVDQVVCYNEPVKRFWQHALTTAALFIPSGLVAKVSYSMIYD